MHCPYCQHHESRVLESRSAEEGQSVRRRRECLQCRRRFTTYERIEFIPITVVKRDGSHESFDRSKVMRGIVRACEKTGVSLETIEAMVEDLEAQFQLQRDRPIESREIGEAVLARLRPVNEVAWVRFASVYRQFQGLQDFAAALHQVNPVPGIPGHSGEVAYPPPSLPPSQWQETAPSDRP
ncbi:MAG TPA: transcriptional regulator NrdR [Cyanobacteria bacterium UBA8156]|jgi:transcriptional repressor NrdR|nr:transcriptional regulator NrdR [Cyanobacteria bacterium UBA8156]